LCAAERHVWDFRDDDRHVPSSRARRRETATRDACERARARRASRDAAARWRARDDATRDARDDAAMRRDA
jgi:hypothetical protein